MNYHVIYHDSCADGFCSAWVARNALIAQGVPLDAITFTPAQYGQAPPAINGGVVYVLDFSYPREQMLDIAALADVLTVLDHHATAEAALAGLQDEINDDIRVYADTVIQFDMKKSGGRLTWEYFHGDKKSPWLVDYTEDRDLWIWALEGSREINAALRSYPMTFNEWDAFDRCPSAILNSLARDGTAILRAESQVIAKHVEKAVEITLDGYKVLCVNATTLISEIAGELATGRPFGVCYFVRGDGAKVCSLRSCEGGADVSEIAKRYGGGGHRNAAGFTVMPEKSYGD